MKNRRPLPGARQYLSLPARQAGGLTIFSAVILLSLLTLMLIYSSQVQRAEQTVSANEYRQKLAFHAAESAADQVMEYMLANNFRILSAESDAVSDGSGGSRAGWFESTVGVWTACPSSPATNHPCGGDIPAGGLASSYFYDDKATTTTDSFDAIPINLSELPADTTARVSAVICQIDFANPSGGCITAPSAGDDISQGVFVITVLSYGYTDCTDPTDFSSCHVTSTIAVPITSLSLARGAPAVPLTTRTTFPPTGTAEIVPNPNAGGVGVPVSVWANANPSCSDGAALLGSGSWATCEYHEWYETDEIPPDMVCSSSSCSCSKSEALSYTVGPEDQLGIDLLEDTQFPCDLFDFYFGVPRSEYQLVKSTSKIISDCSNLDQYSQGVYWVSGSECRLDGSTVIGSPSRPVMLISAAGTTTFTGSNHIFGVVFITDVEVPGADWRASGTNIVYGSVIVDASLDAFLGTFQVVYNEDVSLLIAGFVGIGALSGGWRDFGLPVLNWEG
jgi:Tfp pilus assembly protein PilX